MSHSIPTIELETPWHEEEDMDRILSTKNVGKDLRPKWTCWNPMTVSRDIKAHTKRCRRAYKQYLKTGTARDFNRANAMITRWDFD
jgi:hypothetical protein